MTENLHLRYLREYQKDPTSRVFAPLADCYRKMKKTDEALKICLDGLRFHPRYAGGRVALAHCYFDLERFDEALKEYEAVLAHYPDNLHAIRGAARCYQSLNQLEKAVRYYRMYHFLVPKDQIVLDHLRTLEARLKISMPPQSAPAASAPKTAHQGLLFDDTKTVAWDQYRLSALGGRRPVQRAARDQTKKGEGSRKIQLLYRLLNSIQKARMTQPRLDAAKPSSAI